MSELFSQTLTAFTIGLLGSGHCLAMCGGIMGALSMRSLAGGDDNKSAGGVNVISVSSGGAEMTAASTAVNVRGGALFGDLLLYSAGRLLSYAILGMALGLLGAVLVTAMEPARIILRGLAGGLLIAMGLYLAGVWHGILILERLGHRLWQRIGPGIRAGQGSTLLLGMSWGLLPCGLVYGTLAWAASVADPLRAGWLMFAFGLGTLPAVVAGGWFSTAVLAPLRRRGLRLAAGALIVVFGIWTLIGGGVWQHGEGAQHHGHDSHAQSFKQTTGIMTAGSIIAVREGIACS